MPSASTASSSDHPSLEVTLVTNREASVIMDRVATIAPKVRGEGVSLRGYGAIRNMGFGLRRYSRP
ncbi:MAG: hypothetical protein ACLTSX_05565 [Collinsella sp.]